MAVNQFLLLLWKNWLLQRRKVLLTLFEIGLPTVFALILVLIRPRVSIENYPNVTNYKEIYIRESYLPLQIRALSCCLGEKLHMAYSPKNEYTDKIMENFLKLYPNNDFLKTIRVYIMTNLYLL